MTNPVQLKTICADDVNTIYFEKKFNTIINKDDSEFYNIPGKEHYRLLSYLSTLYNNSIIIDIGTHRGSSATALSYNSTNTIYSFDIVDKIVNNSIKQIPNIKFQYDDLFDKTVFDKWTDIILSCPFIFLDVDPHNGTMENTIYSYLKEINYPGFIVCDDIWYFKEMRDNFWYKIPDMYRYDLTVIGHWSGTGIFTFNNTIQFPKYNLSNWTLVTAYFNLTKCDDASEEILKRDSSYYFNSAFSTLSLPHNLVVYCDTDSIEQIKRVRPLWLQDQTRYVICNFDDFSFKGKNKKNELNNELIIELNNELNIEPKNNTFKEYREKIISNRKRVPYHFDNRNTASYYLFCLSRYIMLKETITNNPFNSTHFGWINFCIERMGYKNLIYLDESLSINRNKFSTCYIDYIPESLINNTAEYFRYGRCSMCSGFFTGNSEYMYKVCDLIENKFLEYLELGYGHADEQLYSPVYFQNRELFDHYYGDYQEMITNYACINDRPEPPIYNFIRNSFNNGDYENCLRGCKFVFASVLLDRCSLNKEYMQTLNHYYMECNKILL